MTTDDRHAIAWLIRAEVRRMLLEGREECAARGVELARALESRDIIAWDQRANVVRPDFHRREEDT